ncbi:MAG: hypothetical protein ACK559_34645, partial [bacterium]
EGEAGPGAGGVHAEGGAVERRRCGDLGPPQEAHEAAADGADDDAGHGARGMRAGRELRQGAGGHAGGEDQKERTLDLRGPPLDLAARGGAAGGGWPKGPEHHRGGAHLHGCIDAEAEQGEGLLRGAEPDGDTALDDVPGDGGEGEPTGPARPA